MAHFYAGVQGNRGQATRLGTKASGMIAFVNGWNIGVDVLIHHVNGKDMLEVSLTGGSNGHSASKRIAHYTEDEAAAILKTI